MAHNRLIPLRRPAEWAKHARTLLAFPSTTLPPYQQDRMSLSRATNDICSIAEAVSRFEPVTLLVTHDRLPQALERFPATHTPHAHQIHVQPTPGEDLDLWMRDFAPTYTLRDNKQLHGVLFIFNGWGGRSPSATCRAFGARYLRATGTPSIDGTITTEGGALEVDGEGTLLASESSLLNSNRNPGRSKAQIEEALARTLGISKFIWVPGVAGVDATDFHIDAYARFARPGVLLLSTPSDTEEGGLWTEAYKTGRRVLEAATDAAGRKLEIIAIQEPRIEKVVEGEEELRVIKEYEYRPVHSYVNFLIVNGGVIVPQFGDVEMDKKAVETVTRVFGREREVVPVWIGELPLLGGGIHCASQEVPWTD